MKNWSRREVVEEGVRELPMGLREGGEFGGEVGRDLGGEWAGEWEGGVLSGGELCDIFGLNGDGLLMGYDVEVGYIMLLDGLVVDWEMGGVKSSLRDGGWSREGILGGDIEGWC